MLDSADLLDLVGLPDLANSWFSLEELRQAHDWEELRQARDRQGPIADALWFAPPTDDHH